MFWRYLRRVLCLVVLCVGCLGLACSKTNTNQESSGTPDSGNNGTPDSSGTEKATSGTPILYMVKFTDTSECSKIPSSLLPQETGGQYMEGSCEGSTFVLGGSRVTLTGTDNSKLEGDPGDGSGQDLCPVEYNNEETPAPPIACPPTTVMKYLFSCQSSCEAELTIKAK